MSTEDKIVEILNKKQEMRLNDLVEATRVSRQMVHRAVKNLVSRGTILKIGTAPKTYYKISQPHRVTKKKPIFDKRIFWDVDFNKIDYQAHSRFVIERVFERGDVQDIRNCRRYYGDDKISKVLLNAKFLPQVTMYLASAVINRPINEFRCFILRQSNPGLFPY